MSADQLRYRPDPEDDDRAVAPAEPLRLDGLTDLLGFGVRMAQLSMYRDFITAIKGLDLTQKQCAVMTLIYDNPGCSQIALAGVLDTDRATMMAIVDRLQDRGLLFRTRSKTDRRRQELYLTEPGEAVWREAHQVIDAHERRFKDLFSQAELTTLRELLGRIEQAV